MDSPKPRITAEVGKPQLPECPVKRGQHQLGRKPYIALPNGAIFCTLKKTRIIVETGEALQDQADRSEGIHGRSFPVFVNYARNPFDGIGRKMWPHRQ
jgi:nitrite reductase/ring-hydroxylating ferredoxin subunit